MKKRIPRNYDGATPTGRQIKELLPGILLDLSEKLNDKPEQILSAWSEIVGKRICRMSRAVSFKEGVLRVQVKNSTLNSLLIEHEKPRLVAAFRKRFPKITFRDIFFRIG